MCVISIKGSVLVSNGGLPAFDDAVETPLRFNIVNKTSPAEPFSVPQIELKIECDNAGERRR